MKVSIGTEGVLGIRKIKMDAAPTTAYLMLGEGCVNNCLFCAQAKNSRANDNMLSRVAWNSCMECVWPLVEKSYIKNKITRACIQVIDQPGIFSSLEHEIAKAKESTNIPICISGGVHSINEVDKLFNAGADRVSIALDAATPEVYRRVKGLDFIKRFYLLEKAANKYPGRISTHFIVGLGETEEEMTDAIVTMYDKGINVGLFAFTPVKGTYMEAESQPPIGTYRRIQIAHYMLRNKICTKESITFRDSKIVKFPFEMQQLKEILSDGTAFMTSGCPGCNRPYYNEKPGSIIYNYPRKLMEEEVERAIGEAELE